MALDNDLNILLALVEHCSSLELFVLLFEKKVELALLGLHHDLHSLVSFLLKLYPFVWRLLGKNLPQALKLHPLCERRQLVLLAIIFFRRGSLAVRST